MLEADSGILLVTCGGDEAWNDRLRADAGSTVRSVSHHHLTGGEIDGETDFEDLFHAFMSQSVHLGERYRRLRDRMVETEIENPRLALTELQLFAGLDDGDAPDADEIPTPQTITEALYDVTIRHECLRAGGSSRC